MDLINLMDNRSLYVLVVSVFDTILDRVPTISFSAHAL